MSDTVSEIDSAYKKVISTKSMVAEAWKAVEEAKSVHARYECELSNAMIEWERIMGKVNAEFTKKEK